MIAFEMSIIFGCFPATHVLFFLCVAIIILPLIIYSHYMHYRERTRHTRMIKSLFHHFISAPYSQERIHWNECPICMVDFIEGQSIVTPLPCNTKHVYHTDCIKSWFKTKNSCPLCNKYIAIPECKELKQDFESGKWPHEWEGR